MMMQKNICPLEINIQKLVYDSARMGMLALALCAGIAGGALRADAQNASVTTPAPAPVNAGGAERGADSADKTSDSDEPEVLPSLFFTDAERIAIEMALEKGNVLDVTDILLPTDDAECLTEECLFGTPTSEATDPTQPRVRRGPSEIELAGVLYFSPYDWTIWLNGERVTPYFIPDEVVKLDVTRDNVYIEWFDEFTNKILRVNLKPHQTFYMDANVILPNQPK